MPTPIDPVILEDDPSNDAPTEPAPQKNGPLPAVSSHEANQIVPESDAERRARVEQEMMDALRTALAGLKPDRGAAVRWLFVGICAGAVLVYVLMAGALHQKEIRIAQLSAQAWFPPALPATTSSPAPPPPLSCPAGAEPALAIPTVSVDQLPRARAAAPLVSRAPKVKTQSSTTLDEDNPYADVIVE